MEQGRKECAIRGERVTAEHRLEMTVLIFRTVSLVHTVADVT